MGPSIIRGRGEWTGSHDLKKTRLTLKSKGAGDRVGVGHGHSRQALCKLHPRK